MHRRVERGRASIINLFDISKLPFIDHFLLGAITDLRDVDDAHAGALRGTSEGRGILHDNTRDSLGRYCQLFIYRTHRIVLKYSNLLISCA